MAVKATFITVREYVVHCSVIHGLFGKSRSQISNRKSSVLIVSPCLNTVPPEKFGDQVSGKSAATSLRNRYSLIVLSFDAKLFSKLRTLLN